PVQFLHAGALVVAEGVAVLVQRDGRAGVAQQPGERHDVHPFLTPQAPQFADPQPCEQTKDDGKGAGSKAMRAAVMSRCSSSLCSSALGPSKAGTDFRPELQPAYSRTRCLPTPEAILIRMANIYGRPGQRKNTDQAEIFPA